MAISIVTSASAMAQYNFRQNRQSGGGSRPMRRAGVSANADANAAAAGAPKLTVTGIAEVEPPYETMSAAAGETATPIVLAASDEETEDAESAQEESYAAAIYEFMSRDSPSAV